MTVSGLGEEEKRGGRVCAAVQLTPLVCALVPCACVVWCRGVMGAVEGYKVLM